MSVVTINGVPANWSRNALTTILNKGAMKCRFEVMSIKKLKGQAVIRVRMNPEHAIQSINNMLLPIELVASIPNQVQKVSKIWRKKPQPKKTSKAAKPTGLSVYLQIVHRELLEEIQRKYPGLQRVSKRMDDKLLDEISMEIFVRIKVITDGFKKTIEDCAATTNTYRHRHPHSRDFQFVVSSMRKVEDAAGVPHTEITEDDLMTPSIENLPCSYEDITKVSYTIGDKIASKVDEYVAGLDFEEKESDTPEEKGNKRVVRELRNMGLNLGGIVKQLISNKFPVPLGNEKSKKTCAIRIYGEPRLPRPKIFEKVLKQYHPISVHPSGALFNMLRMLVPEDQFLACLQLSGKTVGGCKLIVGPSVITTSYKCQPPVLAKILQAYKDFPPPPPPPSPPPRDEDGRDWLPPGRGFTPYSFGNKFKYLEGNNKKSVYMYSQHQK